PVFLCRTDPVLLNQAQGRNCRLINCRRDCEPVIGLVICDCRTRVRSKDTIDWSVVITLVVQLRLNVCDDLVWRQIVVAVDRTVVSIISLRIVPSRWVPIDRIKEEGERLGIDGNKNDSVAMMVPPTAIVPLGLVIAKRPVLPSVKRIPSPIIGDS